MRNPNMKRWGLTALLVLLGLFPYAIADTGTKDKASKDYKVGERLPAASNKPASSSIPYRALNWDELMPTDWDPMKALKGLDLSKMEDSDPRAMEALEKVRIAWNDAPVVPKLNGARIEIPGFVVPLDVDPNQVKEFLLVPYYGACIHVPPPPSNQVLHVVVPKTLTKKQQAVLKNAVTMYGAISVSGTLETVSINTPMGFSSYRLKADLLDSYKPPETSPTH
ncbi:MAG: DUF3299 domain-containing protein [Nitrosomonadales bacterium]|nr:DUF3299 domain-containing protein [Nitrosomonadales bacterium]